MVVYVQTREKLAHGLLNILEKLAQIMDFSKFSTEKIENFRKFLKIFHQFVFRPNARKFNAWFVKFSEKYPKIMHFLQLS